MLNTIAAAVMAGIAFTAPQAALDPGDGLGAIQECTERATQERIRALDGALERVEDHGSLTGPHRERAQANLNEDRQAMEAIRRENAQETDAAEARGACRDVATEHRVFAVTLPQTHFAAAADRLTETAIPRLEELYDTLAVAAKGNADAEAALAEFRTAIDEAIEAADGVADAALAIEPEDFNADPTVIAEVREDLREAAHAVREAMRAARDVRAAL